MQFPFITYGMVLYLNDSIPTNRKTLSKCMCMRASLENCGFFTFLNCYFFQYLSVHQILCRYKWHACRLTCTDKFPNVPTNFQMYRQNSEKALLGSCPPPCPPPPPGYANGNMTMSNHVSSLTRSLNFNLRNIGRIRRYIDEDTCNHTVRSLVLSRLDYSNSLLHGITVKDMKKLQTIQNRSARIIFKTNPREHTSPLLQQLHWLPVSKRIVFKILFLVFKIRIGDALGYIPIRLIQ